jgi:histidyl-tRNA synthetase
MKFQPPKGMRDFLPEEAVKFNWLIEVVKSTFEKYGFEPLFSPAVENFELLSAKGGLGEAVKNEIYYFKDKSERELGLRFDLTMPLARIASSNPQLPKPFKRYQIERVWRYDNPQAMRYREFWQADIDTVGSYYLVADAECLACVCEILDKLGFKDYLIRVNSRRLIEKLLEKNIGKEKIQDGLRILDKLDKKGIEWVKIELSKIAESEKI